VSDQEDTTKKGWKKVVEPIERKGGYSGSEAADDKAPPKPPAEPEEADEGEQS
jgi:hypothetical protein